MTTDAGTIIRMKEAKEKALVAVDSIRDDIDDLTFQGQLGQAIMDYLVESGAAEIALRVRDRVAARYGT